MWVYVRSEPNLWTVGFYDPSGKWHSDSDHDSSQKAASRCIDLNGGTHEKTRKELNNARLAFLAAILSQPDYVLRVKSYAIEEADWTKYDLFAREDFAKGVTIFKAVRK